MNVNHKLVIIPTYNERENIEAMIRRVLLLNSSFHMLIIDDGSPDGTSLIVKRLQEEYIDRLNLIERKGKLGLGTAYIEGFKWALNKGFRYVFEMDADFSHNPSDLPRLIKATQENDLVIGSRKVNLGKIIGWNWRRHFCSNGAMFFPV